ncbi:SpoIIE family protein phosphatase [Spirochaeta isovalerica]|uniref:PAS domain S-box-containing protein n=1 Tax=Spirochaeta isovalerica TaxID=150 RepID=A0A841RCP8_9SPIO|nr:SpoIIE family protein phosphatase [Spirochaeta isovalerica]MBB6480172.1 PAS domain S-box-containing protein [Spirochaeta isovalerica]
MEQPSFVQGDLSSLLMAVRTALFLIDIESGTIVFANEKAGELVGIPFSELSGRNCKGTICAESGIKCADCAHDHIVDEELAYISHSDGSFIPVVKSLRTVRLRSRVFLLETYYDISNIKKTFSETERQMKEALELSEKANRLMEGREARIRDIKKEINDLTTRLGWGEVYRDFREEDFNNNTDLSDPAELRKNALSLAEDAVIERQKAVEAHRELLIIKHAVNSSNDAMTITRSNGDVYFRNTTFDELFCFSPAEIMAAGLDNLFPDRGLYEQLNAYVREGKSWSDTVEVRKSDGMPLTVLLRLSPIYDEEDQLLGSIWHFIDISRQVEYQKQIVEDLKEKQELLRKAVILQNSYIQKKLPFDDSFNIEGLFFPCENLGGDFFRVLKGLCDNKLIFILGDCTDHGIRASMDASLLLSLTEPHIHNLYNGNRTDLFMTEVSRHFALTADEDQFPTMFVMVIDCEEGMVYYSSANATNPLICRKGAVERLPHAAGLHIGYEEKPEYERKSFKLEQDARLILFSDALMEILDDGLIHYDTGPIRHLLEHSEKNLGVHLNYIVEHLLDDSEGFNTSDDMTLLLLEYKPPVRLSYKFSSLEQWKDIHDQIRDLLEKYDYRYDEVTPMAIALDEMVINAVVHGNKNDVLKNVVVEGSVSCQTIEFSITDQGQGFDCGKLSDPTEVLEELMEEDNPQEYTHGRGIWISRVYVDSLAYSDKGNSVTLVLGKKERRVRISNE